MLWVAAFEHLCKTTTNSSHSKRLVYIGNHLNTHDHSFAARTMQLGISAHCSLTAMAPLNTTRSGHVSGDKDSRVVPNKMLL